MSVFSFLKSPLGRGLLATLAAAGLLAWVYHAVYDRGYGACARDNQAVLADQIHRAAEQAREIALKDAEIVLEGEKLRQKIRTVYRDREIEVKQYVPEDCNRCAIAPPGLGLLNDALAGKAASTPNPAQPSAAVPEPSVPGKNGYTPGAWVPGDRYQQFVL